MQPKTNAHGVASLTMSIFSILFAGCAAIGLPIGITALILGIIGMQKTDRPTGTAIAGTIISSVGCIFSLFALVYFLTLGGLITAITDAVF